MSHVSFSDLVQTDLEDIWTYIARDNVDAASRFIESFDPVFFRLAENPYLGKNRDDLFKDIRQFFHGSYDIFYFPTVSGVRIYRILHRARHHRQIFFNEDE